MIGRYLASDQNFDRAARVVVRGEIGLQIGQVLGPCGDGEIRSRGVVLRTATSEDELLAARLESHRLEAIDRCQRELDARGSSACLLDAEYSLDGRRLCFYFLGDAPSETSRLLDELADLYGAEVQLEAFAKTLLEGCGPDCGNQSEECAAEGCSICALAAACPK